MFKQSSLEADMTVYFTTPKYHLYFWDLLWNDQQFACDCHYALARDISLNVEIFT